MNKYKGHTDTDLKGIKVHWTNIEHENMRIKFGGQEGKYIPFVNIPFLKN